MELCQCVLVCEGGQIKLGKSLRHLVGGMGWSLWMIAKSVGMSTASVARGIGVKEGLLLRLPVLDPE